MGLVCSEASGEVHSGENVIRSASMSPQSVVSSGADSGVDSFSDQMGDLPSIAISLCGGLTDNREITKGEQLPRIAVFSNHFGVPF